MSQGDAKDENLTRGEWAEPASTARSVIPVRQLMTGGRNEMASETRALLQKRLRAASLALAVAFGIVLVRDISFRHAHRLIAVHVLVALILSVATVALRARWEPTTRQLRALELALFGVVLASLVARQAMGLEARLVQGQLAPEELRLLFKNSIIGTLLLILTYGIFVPNRWQRAVWFVVLMAAAPLVAPLVLGLASSDFRQVAIEAWTLERLSENVLYLALAAAIAIFGAYTISTLGDDEFRARWLNQYRLTRKLGSGGMGEVFLAEHEMLRRPCAVKLIRPHLSEQPRVLARFEREAQATARLSHWNTVELFDYGRTADGTFYYVMEFLPGLSLQQLVERHGPLPAGRAIYLLRQACDALSEAHAAGLIHRDLKPPNIFAAYRGGRYDVAKLLDFGLVKATRDDDSPSLTREGMVTGSPLYMAPEQVMRSHPPDARTDLYALGAIAYFLLTGRPPFCGDDSMEVMIAQARDPVVPLSELQDGIPADLEAVVLRCLEKAPSRRFQDAASLAEALAGCADAEAWSAVKAKHWWQTHEPELVAGQPDGTSSGSGPSGPGLTEAEEDGPTVGGSEVEAVEPIDGSGTAGLSITLGDEPSDFDYPL
jgi:serine/threonine-protein kinase